MRPYGGRTFGYAYDPIGNRASATEAVGGRTLTKSYTANALNQYTAIANPDAVGLRGSATNAATVTVNGNAAMSDDVASAVRPWHFALAADNAAGGLFALAEIVAVVDPPGTNTPDLVSIESGHVYAPPQQEALTYDDDGNLLSDGRWHYTWNGENRLIKAEEQVAPTNRQPYVVEYAYDHQGRMVRKEIKRRDAESQSETPVKAIEYAWDGYNIIRESVTDQSAITNQQSQIIYVWGLDLDGTMQGAGGVGGLLAVTRSDGTFFPAYDANGNITEYVDADGLLAAHYEYSPFGETVIQSGDLAAAFAHGFSSKYFDAETDLYYYGYRFYGPALGRWLNRDPLGEDSGPNVFCFVENNVQNCVDVLGAKILIDEQKMIVHDVISSSARGFFLPTHTVMFECTRLGVLKINGFVSRRIEILTPRLPRWKQRNLNYDKTWGSPRSDDTEWEATYAHELDHWNSYNALFAYLHLLNEFDGTPLGCNCDAMKDMLHHQYNIMIYEAAVKARRYDMPGWNGGGAYPR